MRSHMDQQEGLSSNKTPLFDGTNCAFWSIKMRSHLMTLGFDIWKLVVNGYTTPTTSPKDTTGKKLSNNYARVVNAIFVWLRKLKICQGHALYFNQRNLGETSGYL